MRILLSLTIACLLLALAGCSEKATTPEPSSNITPEVNEVPAEILEVLEANTPGDLEPSPPDDPTGPDWPPPDVVANCDVYAVTFLWGQLQNSVTPAFASVDWDGTLSVNGVAVVHPHMTIDFEEGEDYLVPSDQEAVAAWVSHTENDFDGISFLVFLDRTVTYIMAPTLTFRTEPITLNFDFGDLVKLDALYILDSLRGGVAVHARKIWPRRCPGGFMEGKWIKADNSGMEGRIEGLWLNHWGEPKGYMNGQFTTTGDGERVFHGWVSGYYTDHIIAEFKGRWWYDDPRMCPAPWCGTGHGWFRGQFTSATGDGQGGHLTGEFGHLLAPTDEYLALPYHGVWHAFCPWDHEDIRPNDGSN